MLPERISLVDREGALAAAWRDAFRDVPEVNVVRGDFFSVEAEAMVSPANSFGIMDGGLDAAIRDVLGPEVEARVRARIAERHHGELPVGVAEVLATDDLRWPLLVCAPTMRVPESAAHTTHAYLAFRAALLALRAYGIARGRSVRSVVCPGLCTGVGGMSPRRCAAQMRVAWSQVSGPPTPGSFGEIHRTHQALRSA
jgi:O-acetyl-ADP-ribose deacetylase (regulator of RNase III)